MRKLALLLMALTLALAASAEPAHPQPATLLQSNGESLKIKLVGDEFYHFNTTVDGYTVINNKGSWEYALERLAHNHRRWLADCQVAAQSWHLVLK